MTQHTHPPLPEPARTEVYATARNSSSVRKGFEMGGYIKEPAYYTAEQMHAYADAVRAQALEEIEAMAKNDALWAAEGFSPDGPLAAFLVARWFRALAHPTKQGEHGE